MLLLLPLVVPGPRLMVPACDAFSIVSLGIGGAVASFGVAITFAERAWTLHRWQSRAGLPWRWERSRSPRSTCCSPGCVGGPYSQVAPEIRFWLENVREAQPLMTTVVHDPSLAAMVLVLPVLAVVIALAEATGERGKQRTLWLCLALMAGGGMAVQFWQLRGAFLANAWAGLPLAWLAAKVGERAQRATWRLGRVADPLPALAVAVLPIMAGLLAAAVAGQELNGDKAKKPNWAPRQPR